MITVASGCAVVLNKEFPKDIADAATCGVIPAPHPVRLPSGKVVGWCCEEHRKVAAA